MTSSTRASRVAPVAPKERFELIDVVRGFALFGVLYINLLWTCRYVARESAPEGAFVEGPFDGISFLFSEVFFNHKFYALFSILFGLGFAMQSRSARQRGARIVSVYARRLAILLAIGLIHAFLIWPEDVLHVYALLGFAMVAFRNCTDETLLRWIGVFFALSVLVTILQWSVFNTATTETDAPQAVASDALTETGSDAGPFQLMSSDDYVDLLRFNAREMRRKYSSTEIGPGSMVYWYLSIFWKFLLGMYLGRRDVLQRSADDARMFRRALPWALGAAVLGTVVMALGFGPLEPLMFGHPLVLTVFWLVIEAGMLGIAAFYACVLVVSYHSSSVGKRALSSLAPLGRMALTNYLMHSAIFLLLFYGIGFGLLGKISHAQALPITIAIFGLQVVVSAWWLRRYRFGPAEWLWRSLTYGRLQPMRMGRARQPG